MTRKDALREAVHIVSNARIGKQRKEEILAGLTLCQQELPFAHWTKEAIFDACDTWVQEHGELTVRAFVSPQMPSHPVIKNRFGLTAREFRDRYYPMAGASARSPYHGCSVEEWNQKFKADFHRIHCKGQKDYNRRRNRALPTWNTVAAMNGLKSWRALLKKLNLSTYGEPKPNAAAAVRALGPDT